MDGGYTNEKKYEHVRVEDRRAVIERLLTVNYQIWLLYIFKRWAWTNMAEDILQEAAIRAYNSAENFRYPDGASSLQIAQQFSKWFPVIITRAVIDMRRVCDCRPPLVSEYGDLASIPEDRNDVEALVFAREQLRIITSGCGFTNHEIVALWGVIEGVSSKDLASKTGISRGSLDSALYCVRRKLAAMRFF